MKRCFIAIGSNLDHPVIQVKTALNELQNLPNSKFISASSLYQSKPIGPQNQPDFINAVAAIDTNLTASNLLTELQQIEHRHHRVRKMPWGPRTLDLDLLLYGNDVIQLPKLIVPHPELEKRAFVLIPLAQIAPDLTLPSGKKLSTIIPVADTSLIRIMA